MTINEFLESAEFKLMMDETMRDIACETVESFIETSEYGNRVRPSQIHALQDIIRATGLRGLRELASVQREKNTNKENKEFWGFVESLVSEGSRPKYGKVYPYSILQEDMTKRGILPDPDAVSEKTEQKKTRKQRQALIDKALDRALPSYFEHFNCHYLYKTRTV